MLIGLTGPSSHSNDLMRMLEKYFHANFILLYHDHEENLNYWLEKIDGVVLAGGVDIHPTVYGQSITSCSNLTRFDIMRDNRELHILHYCMQKKIPVLAICRGHQLMGIYHGMQLIQDISASAISHNPSKANISVSKNEPTHSVRLLKGAQYREDYGMSDNPEERKVFAKVRKQDLDYIWVNSFHHQALEYIPKQSFPDVNIRGVSRIDLNKIECIVEFMDGSHWVSVQWHPEVDWEENSYSRSILAKYKSFLRRKNV